MKISMNKNLNVALFKLKDRNCYIRKSEVACILAYKDENKEIHNDSCAVILKSGDNIIIQGYSVDETAKIIFNL